MADATSSDPSSYDELGLFHENADEAGLDWHGPPAVRRVETDLGDGRTLSGLRWGTDAPQVVLLHGGGQNAHTWDTVALALGRPLLALDDQHRFTRDDQESLLVGLPVVHPHRLARPEHRHESPTRSIVKHRAQLL